MLSRVTTLRKEGCTLEHKINPERVKENISTLLNRATDKQLRIIYLVAYEIVK